VKRWNRRAISIVLTAVVLTLSWTTPAVARTCKYWQVNDPSGNSLFAVCITKINNGYDAYLEEYAGGLTYLVDFNLIHPNGWVGDQGPFYISPGVANARSYFFNTGYFDWAVVRVYWRANYNSFNPLDSYVCTTSC